MGSPVSSVVANLFMERFEEGALQDAIAFQPRIWRRYVDDVFSIVLRSMVSKLLLHLNGMDENIRFTTEQEKDRCLPFLDVSVRRRDDGSLRTGVFRKETHTDRTLAFNSHHAQSAKRAVVRALLDRVDTHFSEGDTEGRAAETIYAREVLAKNGYPDRFIQNVIRRRNSDKGEVRTVEMVWVAAPYVKGMSEAIARVLRPLGISLAHSSASWRWYLCKDLKDKIAIHRKSGVVYEVKCEDCDDSYIGESGRCLEVRIGEHKRHVKKGEVGRSAIAEHVMLKSHTIDWESASVIDVSKKYWQRRVKEALHIAQCKNTMNKDNGLQLSKVWLHVLEK